ncbi:unnamed protein product [Candida verbasci]|uniref:Presequence translocated-associated motor subunit PAM17 n=1 Tax=Candida verbasci TaxID=1227364 RepID=A0A9W4XLQ5_9ASCO|nr:unnamed protein product [Candida verbasci]
MFQLGVYNKALTRKAITGLRYKSTSQPLTWIEYFKLKKQSNRINMVSGIFTGLGGALITLNYLGNIEIDPEKPIMGFDPLMVMGGVVGLGAFVGYLAGPTIGTIAFKLINKSKLQQFELKNSEFLTRLIKNRPDPSYQSFSNPIPDYYGEKIYSLKDYGQWLRDCNAFRRKAKEFL